jgi:hypothetical protein
MTAKDTFGILVSTALVAVTLTVAHTGVAGLGLMVLLLVAYLRITV